MHAVLEGLVVFGGDGAGAHEDQAVVRADDGARIRVEHALASLLVAEAEHYGVWKVLVQFAEVQALRCAQCSER